MAKQDINTKEGFTIIEVVLVLAIAGLIFLMVFIALPALQRSQRDTQRRDDMARFSSQLTQYQSNNGQKVPNENAATGKEKEAWGDFVEDYLRVDGEDSFSDPNGKPYTVVSVTSCSSSGCSQPSSDETKDDYKNGYIRVYTNATCAGEDPTYVAGKRKVAFTYKLEGAGTYCGNN